MTDRRSRPVADLHVHTTASDGELDLAEIPPLASAAGLAAVAVTDHDRLNVAFDAPVEERGGITLIRGIELKVEPPTGERIDLLGYAVRQTSELRGLIDGLQENRRERGRAIIENVEDHLGLTLDVAVSPGIGRPHIARAVADHPEADYRYREVFDELIGDDAPCFVSRHIPSLDEGMAILDDACPVVAVAHPYRYADVDAAIDVARRVGGIERWYPYGAPVDTRRVDDAIRDAGLIATGGSDAHDDRLGLAGVPREAYDRFARACDLRAAGN